MKKRPRLLPFPFVGAKWEKNGQTFRIIHVQDGIVHHELLPTRGVFPVNVVDWREWAVDATCVEPGHDEEK